MTKPPSLIILSGGLDSTVLMHDLVDNGENVRALSFFYNQRHQREINMAVRSTGHLSVPHKVCDLSRVYPLISSSALHTGTVPTGHYAEESMKATVVPNRNMIFLSIAVGHAISIGADRVYYAAHSGDHTIYPDCRPEFVHALDQAIRMGNEWTPVDLIAPYITMSKVEVVKRGFSLHVLFSDTWSCYVGGRKACGKCGTCVERLEAFHLAGGEDPLQYEDREWWKGVAKK